MARSRGGKPWSQGGKYAFNPGRNTLKLDTSEFMNILYSLEKAGGNARKAAEEGLKKVGKKIAEDTLAAIDKPNLPRQGKYSHGETRNQVITDPQVTWEGMKGWIPVGFDYSLPGAGGYLITGRHYPSHMDRVQQLWKIYMGKKYMRDLMNDLRDEMFVKTMDWKGFG